MVAIPIPNIKLLCFIFFLLSIWAIQVPWLPRSYILTVCSCLAFFLWSIINKESYEPLQMLMVSLSIGVLMDVVYIFLYYSRGQIELVENGLVSLGEYRFSAGMAVLNMILKPAYIYFVFRHFLQRGGDPSKLLKFKGLLANQEQGYQNMEDGAPIIGGSGKDPIQNPQFVSSTEYTAY